MTEGFSLRLLLTTVAILVVLLVISMVVPDSLQVFAPAQAQTTGSLIVTVVDGFTEQPLKGARVVIPEAGQSALTDAQGKTGVLQAPIAVDTVYQNILPKSWGEITLLVYYPGYIDCAIFHVNITQDRTRQGPTVLMFPLDADGSNQPFTLIESPNRQWVQELLNKYRSATD